MNDKRMTRYTGWSRKEYSIKDDSLGRTKFQSADISVSCCRRNAAECWMVDRCAGVASAILVFRCSARQQCNNCWSSEVFMTRWSGHSIRSSASSIAQSAYRSSTSVYRRSQNANLLPCCVVTVRLIYRQLSSEHLSLYGPRTNVFSQSIITI